MAVAGDFETGLREFVKALNLIANKANERKRSHRGPKSIFGAGCRVDVMQIDPRTVLKSNDCIKESFHEPLNAE